MMALLPVIHNVQVVLTLFLQEFVKSRVFMRFRNSVVRPLNLAQQRKA